jgi:hypothetical protein
MSPREIDRETALVLHYYSRPWGTLFLWGLMVAGLLAAAMAA